MDLVVLWTLWQGYYSTVLQGSWAKSLLQEHGCPLEALQCSCYEVEEADTVHKLSACRQAHFVRWLQCTKGGSDL